MQIKRKSTSVWNGTGKEGKGHLTSQSGVLNQTQFGFKSRFEDGIGTNPEELIAAAHAGCFSMKMAFVLQGQGFAANEIKTDCEIVLDNGIITNSNLHLTASVDGLDATKFAEFVKEVEENCLVSKLFNCTITVTSTLL